MSKMIEIGVCGAHMEGLPLNHQLLNLGATFVKACKTAVGYRLFNVPEKILHVLGCSKMLRVLMLWSLKCGRCRWKILEPLWYRSLHRCALVRLC